MCMRSNFPVVYIWCRKEGKGKCRRIYDGITFEGRNSEKFVRTEGEVEDKRAIQCIRQRSTRKASPKSVARDS